MQLPLSILTIIFISYRRTYKFCANCGTLGKTDALKRYHMKGCQPNLKAGENGFLMDGELPNYGIDDFKMTLRLLGGTEKA